MREQDVFVLADRALERVVQQIRDDQWEMALPPEFRRREDGPATLREVINYHAYDEAWIPDILAGRTMDEAGKERFDGDVLGAEPKATFRRLVGLGCAAATALDDPERTVHLSYGDYKAHEYLWHANYFRGIRAYEIAKLIGVEPALEPELVEALWEELSPHAEEWRAIGVFGPRVEVPDDAPLLTRLLAITGREV